MAEARLQATDDLGFEAAHMIRRFLSQPTMEFFRQAKANNPMSRPPFHQGKASDNRSNGDPDNQAGNGNNDDGHGDTPPIRRPYLQSRSYDHIPMATDHPTTWVQSRI
jgi:hypothetical protein